MLSWQSRGMEQLSEPRDREWTVLRRLSDRCCDFCFLSPHQFTSKATWRKGNQENKLSHTQCLPLTDLLLLFTGNIQLKDRGQGAPDAFLLVLLPCTQHLGECRNWPRGWEDTNTQDIAFEFRAETWLSSLFFNTYICMRKIYLRVYCSKFIC